MAGFLICTATVAVVGLSSTACARRTESDFLLADRGLGAWVAGLSSAASAESGWVTLGLVGFAFSHGVAAYWVIPGTVAAFAFNWFVLAPRLRTAAEQTGALTITDVLVRNVRGPAAVVIRGVSIGILLSMLTAYAAAQFNSAGKLFAASFGWSWTAGVLAGAAIVLAYTISGGFRAIAWTDVLQAALMIFVMTGVPALLIHRGGGLHAVWQTLQQLEPDERLTRGFGGRSGAGLVGFLTLWLGIPLGNPGQPHVIVRLMAVRDRRAILRGGVISTVWVMILFSGAVTLGLAARVHFGDLSDPEQALPLLAADAAFLPGLLGGVILAAIFAAICSTADSQLLVAASAISHDLRAFRSRQTETGTYPVILDRAAVLGVGSVAVAVALSDMRSVFDFVLAYGWAGLGAGFGPALIFVLLDPRVTGAGVAGGMIAGVSTAVAWRLWLPEWNAVIYNLIPGFVAATLVILLTRRRRRENAGPAG